MSSNTQQMSERISEALASIALGRETYSVEHTLNTLVQEYNAAHERISGSRLVSASELDAMSEGVAGLDVVQRIVTAVEQCRVTSLDDLVGYLVTIGHFHIPTNGGSHSLISQHTTKIALRVVEQVLRVR